MRRTLVSLVTLALVLVLAPSAAAAGGCAERFPGATFDTSATVGQVAVVGAGLVQDVVDRYARSYEPVVTMAGDHYGTLEGVEVCVFADAVPLDAADYDYPDSLPIRSIAFADEGLVVLSAWRVAAPIDAGLVGLTHVAQVRAGGGSYPEPFGSDVIGWYRNEIEGTVEAVHNRFVRSNIGLREPWDPIPWLSGSRGDVLVWNAETALSSSFASSNAFGGPGDFAHFAVENGGPDVLTTLDGDAVAALDEQWRQALFDESGAIPGGSRGWIRGVLFALGALAVAVGVAWWSWRIKRREKQYLLELARRPEPVHVPEADDGPIRVSVPGGLGRRDAGVGRGRARAVRSDRDDRDRPPSRRKVGTGVDPVATGDEPGDDAFRHPGLRGED